MAVLNKNPWGDQSGSFENLTNKARPVVKAVTDTVKVISSDVVEQLTGNYNQSSPDNPNQNTQNKPTDDPNKKQKQLNEVRQNLESINNQIKAIRQKKAQETRGEEKKKDEKKQVEEKKKQKEPIWKKFLQGKKGSRESHQRAGG